MKRQLNVALGWSLPGWLLDLGPVAFIVVAGVGAVAVRPHGNVSTAVLVCGWAVVPSAIGAWRTRTRDA